MHRLALFFSWLIFCWCWLCIV